MFYRIMKFSLALFKFVIAIPFIIIAIAKIFGAALLVGGIAGIVMYIVFLKLGFPGEYGFFWSIAITPLTFASLLYRRFVLGEGDDL